MSTEPLKLTERGMLTDLLGAFGKEVAESTRQLLNGEIDQETYIQESTDQILAYREKLLEWITSKN
jgi:hypothetical protein